MILLYGIKKSGTTFLQRLLDSDEIFSPPVETKIKFFDEFLVNKNKDELIKYFPISNEEFFDKKIFIENIEENYNRVKKLKNFIDLHLFSSKLASKKQLTQNIDLIKEVSGNPKEIISNFLDISNNNKVILIRRSSIFILKAIFNNRKHTLIDKFVRCYTIIKLNFILDYLIKEYEPGKLYIVHYKDLLGEKKKTEIDKVFNFLKLEVKNINYFPTLLGEKTRVKTASKKNFNNLEKFQTSILNKIIIIVCLILFRFYFFIKSFLFKI